MIFVKKKQRKIPLVHNNISKSDINHLVKFIKKAPKLSQGDKVREFETKFSNYIGSKYSVYVNSGSSANLAMVYAMMLTQNLRNKKVVVPALSWSTSVAPLVQLGLEPIVCDVDARLGLCQKSLHDIIAKHDPAVIMLVHPLGFASTEMNDIRTICNTKNIILLEDTCESLGSSCYDYTTDKVKKLGTFGLMSTFSFFVSHHITTIEGGMICTDSKEIYDVLKMIRSHGWDRDLDYSKQCVLRHKHSVSDFDAMYTFYYPSFNIRGTEIGAVMGIRQLDRLDDIVSKREMNFNRYAFGMLDAGLKFIYRSINTITCSNFAYPMIHKDRNKIVEKLNEAGIECRPLICGNIAKQPFLKDVLKYPTETPMADLISEFGFYLPNHPHLTEQDITYVCETVAKAGSEND